VTDLGERQRAVADRIARKINTSLPDQLAARSPAWQTSLRDLLSPYAGQALSAWPADGSAQALLQKAKESLEQAGREVTGGWAQRRIGEVHELITSMVAAEIGALLELSRSPRVAGAEIAGLAADDDRAAMAGWSARDVPDLVVRVPAWEVHIDLPRRSRRKAAVGDAEISRRIADALTAAITSFDGRVRGAFQDAALEWAGRLDDQAVRQARETAAHFRRFLGRMPRDEELAVLDDLAARLAAFKTALGTWEPSPDVASPAADTAQPGSARPAGDCAVCGQMEAVLTSLLRRDQFRLATSERDQERHARGGGFCPLHTWQYEAIASPLGVSAGVAKLAASVADALESLSEHAWSPAVLGRDVAGLTAHPGTCPLCMALADRERSVITQIIARPPEAAAAAALCLRHLALALAASPAAETGRAMLRALAATLRRDAEDMRVYALKREALHSGLVTDEESRAHLDVLRRLAGVPALAQT
jgi:hypothetical protein